MFPIFIISKGRSRNVMATGTTGKLSQFGIPHYIMVEPQEEEIYLNNKYPEATILTIPQSERDKDHERLCDWSIGKEEQLGATMGRGAVASRNSTKRYAEQLGSKAFYNMDDNATGFFKWMTVGELNHYKCWHALQQDESIPIAERSFIKNLKRWGIAKVSMSRFLNEPFNEDHQKLFNDLRLLFNKSEKELISTFTADYVSKNKELEYSVKYDISKFNDSIPDFSLGESANESEKVKKIFFDDFEPNLFKMDNMGFIGYNTVDACPRCVSQYLIRPMGRRVYSCTLMKTDYPNEWWGQTSDDVLLNIDCLSDGYWMACLWRWVMGKPFTQTTKGGCTVDAYGHKITDRAMTKNELVNTEKYALSTYPKTKFITSMYPQYLHTKAWKHRIHHEFLWDLMPNPRVELDPSKYILESKSDIDYLYPSIKEEYKKAQETKRLLTQAPPKRKHGNNGFKDEGWVKIGELEKEENSEDQEGFEYAYQDYDEELI